MKVQTQQKHHHTSPGADNRDQNAGNNRGYIDQARIAMNQQTETFTVYRKLGKLKMALNIM